jgi:hypothetical protein
VNENYLKRSNVIEYHIYDGDREDYKKKVEKMNEEKDGRRFGQVTHLREMENYIPPSLVEEEFSIELADFKDRWKEIDVGKSLIDKAKAEIACTATRERAIKSIISGKIARRVKKEMLIELGVYDEIKTWFEEIAELYNN